MAKRETNTGRQPAELRRQLVTGATVLGITLDEVATNKLLAYVALLAKWNQVYNLTAIDDPQRMVSHHLLDCLAVAPYVHGARILDIGSGAGLPGIPLAILYPDKTFVLLDSNGKKTRFLVQAAAELKLKNTEVVNTRVEQYAPQVLFDTIVARAFSSMGQTLKQSVRLCAPGGQYLFMKGRQPVQEIADIDTCFQVAGTHLLSVPGVEGQRRLIIVTPA